MTVSNPSPADLSRLAGSWTLDPARTTVVFHTKAMWVLKVAGKVQATEGRGAVGPDGSVSGTLVLDAGSVDTGNKKRDTHLASDDFFAAGTHPTIEFRAIAVHVDGSGVEVSGDLTVAGTTRPLSFPVSLDAVDADQATLHAEVTIDRTDFGMTWNKMGMASTTNLVEVTAHLRHTGTA